MRLRGCLAVVVMGLVVATGGWAVGPGGVDAGAPDGGFEWGSRGTAALQADPNAS